MLSPEDAEKVLTKNLANIIRKANAGKSLTGPERALFEQQLAGGSLSGTVSAFAKNWDELAQRLNTTRKTLQNVRERFPGKHPLPRADGRHDVAAWSAFFIQHNIGRAAEDLPIDEAEAMGAPKSVTDWKVEEIKLKCERLSLENAKAAGELIAKAEVEAGMSDLMQGFRQALNNLPGRLAQKVLGCTDYHEAEEIAQNEVNVVLRTLQSADFLDGNPTLETANPVVSIPDQVDAELPDQKARGPVRKRKTPGKISTAAPAKTKRAATAQAAPTKRARRRAGK